MTRFHDSDNAEFVMIIADRFQKQGLGTELLRRLVDTEHIHQIEAYMLPSNVAMGKICTRLGFIADRQSESGMLKTVLRII